MIRLAFAIGFLAVFGVVAYFGVLLVVDFFKNKNKTESKNENTTENQSKQK